jgi:hypothetical protein
METDSELVSPRAMPTGPWGCAPLGGMGSLATASGADWVSFCTRSAGRPGRSAKPSTNPSLVSRGLRAGCRHAVGPRAGSRLWGGEGKEEVEGRRSAAGAFVCHCHHRGVGRIGWSRVCRASAVASPASWGTAVPGNKHRRGRSGRGFSGRVGQSSWQGDLQEVDGQVGIETVPPMALTSWIGSKYSTKRMILPSRTVTRTT